MDNNAEDKHNIMVSSIRLVGAILLITNILIYMLLIHWGNRRQKTKESQRSQKESGPMSNAQTVESMLRASSSRSLWEASTTRRLPRNSARMLQITFQQRKPSSAVARSKALFASKHFDTFPFDEEMGGWATLCDCIQRANSWPSDEPGT